MGWLSDEEGHEGYVRAVAPDGRTSGTSNAAGILLWRPDADQRVAAAWAWRVILLIAAAYVLLRVVSMLRVVIIPIAVAVLGGDAVAGKRRD